jgi:hypothetical protein
LQQADEHRNVVAWGDLVGEADYAAAAATAD